MSIKDGWATAFSSSDKVPHIMKPGTASAFGREGKLVGLVMTLGFLTSFFLATLE